MYADNSAQERDLHMFKQSGHLIMRTSIRVDGSIVNSWDINAMHHKGHGNLGQTTIPRHHTNAANVIHQSHQHPKTLSHLSRNGPSIEYQIGLLVL